MTIHAPDQVDDRVDDQVDDPVINHVVDSRPPGDAPPYALAPSVDAAGRPDGTGAPLDASLDASLDVYLDEVLTDDDILREWYRCRTSPSYFVDRYLRITHKARGVIPFRLWPWQASLLETFVRERQIIILKARQMGLSELVVAYALWLVRFHESKKVLFVSQGEREATGLLARAKLGYLHLPPWLRAEPGAGAPDRTRLVNANQTVMAFHHEDDQGRPYPSTITSLPATESTGRGEPASLLVMDEWAHQPFDAELWAAAEPTIEGGGQVIGLSTANGLGNTFHRVWAAAERHRSGFRSIFLPWWYHPERSEGWYARERAAKEEEGRLSYFHQEYPENPVEAFIQSGRPVFDQEYLTKARRRLDQEVEDGLRPLARADGLTVWEEAVPDHRYVIGADVSEGVADGDYDVAAVVDRTTWRQVAELRGRWPPDVFAGLLDRLGHRYAHVTERQVERGRPGEPALLAVERNNHGHAVLLALEHGVAHESWAGPGKRDAYPNVYRYTEPTTAGARPSSRAGWPTTIQTKPLLIGALGRAVREAVYQPRSTTLLDEMLVFSYDERSAQKTGAPSGHHDDAVMAHAIAVYLVSQPDLAAEAMDFARQWRSLTDARVEQALRKRLDAQTTVSPRAFREGEPTPISPNVVVEPLAG